MAPGDSAHRAFRRSLRRRPRDEPDPLARRGRARSEPRSREVVAVLHRRRPAAILRAVASWSASTLDSADVADLALVLQLDQGADRLLERHLRVEPVELVQVDPVEPSRRRLPSHACAQVLGPAVGRPCPGPGGSARPWSRSPGRRGTGTAPRRSASRSPPDRRSRRCRSVRCRARPRDAGRASPCRDRPVGPQTPPGDAHGTEARAGGPEVAADRERAGGVGGLVGHGGRHGCSSAMGGGAKLAAVDRSWTRLDGLSQSSR